MTNSFTIGSDAGKLKREISTRLEYDVIKEDTLVFVEVWDSETRTCSDLYPVIDVRFINDKLVLTCKK